jgi:threonine dehydrogenase-like Zn-dependent dehydrogenase
MLSTAQDLIKNTGPDVVIDTIANMELMSSALQVLAVKVRSSFISIAQDTEFKVDMERFYRKEQTIVGCNSLEREAGEVVG